VDKIDAAPEMVLCIPGPWENQTDLVRSIATSGSGYLFAGRILLHIETHYSCELVFETVDPRMVEAFAIAGGHWRDTPEMDRIADHRSVVYLVAKGGSQVAAENLMKCAAALLHAGGFGVKVESSVLAHNPSAWKDYCDQLYCFTAHKALVVYLTGPQVHSCGMHNLGMRDAITAAGSDNISSVELLKVFTFYLFSESPIIRAGQTFSVDADAPLFRIENHPGWDYGPDSLFTNPYGAWYLEPI
jgi:hypothetical protein